MLHRAQVRQEGTADKLAVLLLGSNLGHRRRNLALAVPALANRGVRTLKKSKCYHTEPWGVAGKQAHYLNQALLVETGQSPLRLLRTCKTVEHSLGRPRTYARYAPRTLDVDILVFGGQNLNLPPLQVPHPLLLHRLFAMEPMKELWPKKVKGKSLLPSIPRYTR